MRTLVSARCVLLLQACLFFGIAGARAQAFRPSLTAGVGFVETVQDYASLPGYALSPEVEVAAPLVRSHEARLSLSGAVYAGGWRDGVDEPARCADCITYAYSSLVAGARLGVGLDAFPVPLSFWGGLSRHFLFARYVGGAGVAGDIGHDHRDAYTAVEAGARLQVPVGPRLRVGGDVRTYVPLPVDEQNPHLARFRYGVALTYAPQ